MSVVISFSGYFLVWVLYLVLVVVFDFEERFEIFVFEDLLNKFFFRFEGLGWLCFFLEVFVIVRYFY